MVNFYLTLYIVFVMVWICVSIVVGHKVAMYFFTKYGYDFALCAAINIGITGGMALAGAIGVGRLLTIFLGM